jgi:NADH:ubiquinone oxidoreductase subunit 4 (subunit M)
MTGREATIAYVLLAFAIVLGVYPEFMFGLMRSTIAGLVNNLDAAYASLHQIEATMQTSLLP